MMSFLPGLFSKASVKRYTLYVVAIGGLWLALAKNNKAVSEATGLKTPWLVSLVGLGLPTLIIGCVEGIPLLVRWLRERRSRWTLDGDSPPGYFQLTPRTTIPQGQTCFREDRADERILAWIQNDNSPPYLFLSGSSGSGKSSLLDAAVVPALEHGSPETVVLAIRSYAEADIEALRLQLTDPKLIGKDAAKNPPDSLRGLIEAANSYLDGKNRRLLILLDQFEKFVILFGDSNAEGHPLRMLWSPDLRLGPAVQLLFVLRPEYLEDLPDLGLPPVAQDKNWIEVGAFKERHAAGFLEKSELNLGSELTAAIVKHAAALEDTPGKVLPIVLNMMGLALEERPGIAESIVSARDARRLLVDYVRRAIEHPDVREHAAAVLGAMIEEGSRKRSDPLTLMHIARESDLAVKTVYGCLHHLSSRHGLVRLVGAEGPREDHIWEISHDFVAKLLAPILQQLRPSRWQRLLSLTGPVLMTLLVVLVFAPNSWGLGVAALVTTIFLLVFLLRPDRELSDARRFDDWMKKYSAQVKKTPENTYSVDVAYRDGRFISELPQRYRKRVASLKILKIPEAILRDPESWSGFLGQLVRFPSLTSLDLSYNGLISLAGLPRLNSLMNCDLSYNGLSSLAGLPQLNALVSLDLAGNDLCFVAGLPQLKALKRLELFDNRLSSLAGFPQLNELVRLNLGANDLGSLAGLPQLKSLSELKLSHNKLTTLRYADLAVSPNLVALEVSNNPLEFIHEDISSMTGLRELHLRECPNLFDPPREVVEMGGVAVLEFLREKWNARSQGSAGD